MPLLFDPHPPFILPVEGHDGYPVRRIFCIGRNYAAHAAEMGAVPQTDAPFFFTKTPTHAVHSGSDWRYPAGTQEVHHEVELVVALGPEGIVAAAGVGLDMTRRDLQTVSKQRAQPWDVGKDFEGSAILAPLRPTESIGPLDITLQVNNEMRQAGNTRDMIHDVPAVLAHLGALYMLGPGDLVMTGTPAGVGAVAPGDTLLGRIEGLADLTVTVI